MKKELSDFLTELPFRCMSGCVGISGLAFAAVQSAIATSAFEKASEYYPKYILPTLGNGSISLAAATTGIISAYIGSRFCYKSAQRKFTI